MPCCFRLATVALLTVSAGLAMQPAHAATAIVDSASTAANACLPALPAFEGTIRKRPLSVQNEGSTNAFITCSLAAGGDVRNARLYANSIDGQAHAVSCTAVVGYNTAAPKYVTKDILVPADGSQASLNLVPSDVMLTDNLGSFYVSFSCQVPPGTGINDVSLTWLQEVGA